MQVPVGACVLASLGGALLVLEGFAALVGASLLAAVGVSAPGVAGLAALLVLDGILVLLIGFFLLFNPRSHQGCGIALVTLGTLSLPLGGGFFLGAVVTLVGGVLAIVFRPTPVEIEPPRTMLEEAEDDPVLEADLIDAGVLVPPADDPSTPGP
jgi:hypothetical protein